MPEPEIIFVDGIPCIVIPEEIPKKMNSTFRLISYVDGKATDISDEIDNIKEYEDYKIDLSKISKHHTIIDEGIIEIYVCRNYTEIQNMKEKMFFFDVLEELLQKVKQK